ncbi:conserved phage C-terminal domain-containing protein [Vagococcus fluvialis]|uniref:conserved phage C-terminal domain-containing protein n=1 Tax=Vagococcus fluvialis TaxID=2738 RepID=UPI003D0F6EDA
MKEEPNYYAIIPANIRYDEDLIQGSKLLYGEITALSNQKGFCWANDMYFANLYKVSKKTIQTWLKSLEVRGYLTREVIYKEGSNEIVSRYIRLCAYPSNENVHTPMHEKVRDNNTSINTTINNTSNKNILSSSDEQDDVPYKEIVDYLNLKTSKSYKHSTSKTKSLIKARWNEGFRVDDFKKVIDNKCFEWIGNPGMAKYLRPETLFGTKFEGYLNENNVVPQSQEEKDYGWE